MLLVKAWLETRWGPAAAFATCRFAGSRQFIISLPVTKRKLLAVRVGIGMFETVALTVFIGTLAWSLRA